MGAWVLGRIGAWASKARGMGAWERGGMGENARGSVGSHLAVAPAFRWPGLRLIRSEGGAGERGNQGAGNR